jgi:hypothetical protein
MEPNNSSGVIWEKRKKSPKVVRWREGTKEANIGGHVISPKKVKKMAVLI